MGVSKIFSSWLKSLRLGAVAGRRGRGEARKAREDRGHTRLRDRAGPSGRVCAGLRCGQILRPMISGESPEAGA